MRNNSIIARFRAELAASKQLFADSRDEIMQQNLYLLHVTSLWGILLFGVLFALSAVLNPAWKLTLPHIALIAALLLFYLFSYFYKRFAVITYRGVQIACGLFYIAAIGCVMVISIFAYPNEPCALVSLSIMFIPSLFIFPPRLLTAYLLAGEAAFALLTFWYKGAPYAAFDISTSFVALVLAFILFFQTFQLRLRDYHARARYQRLSTLDALTGILNKNACEECCRNYLSTRMPNNGCAMFLIDLDDFKNVNDTLGHRAGDELLEAVGSALVNCFRSNDIVGRVGGDEFLVLLKNLSQTDYLPFNAKRIQKAIELASQSHLKLRVTCSIGVAVSSTTPATFDDLFLRADAAMYEAKKAGKSRYFIKTVN